MAMKWSKCLLFIIIDLQFPVALNLDQKKKSWNKNNWLVYVPFDNLPAFYYSAVDLQAGGFAVYFWDIVGFWSTNTIT